MKHIKFTFLTLLLIALVFVGFGCTKSPTAFYKRACKLSVPFQEKLADFYDYDSMGSELGFYDDVDECTEDSLEYEEEVYEDCLDEEDEEDCQERIDEWRETIMEMLTREGCEDMYGSQCKGLSSKAKKDCMEEIEELCEDLPKNF